MNMLQWLVRKVRGKSKDTGKHEAPPVSLTPTPGFLARMGAFAHSRLGKSWTEDEAKLATYHIQRRASNRTSRASRRANRGRHAMSGHAA
jgi:hypothetical protein